MNIDDPSKFVCRLPGCGGPRSGICINTLPFDECPDVIAADQVDRDVETTEVDVVESGQQVMLPGGRSFDVTACDRFLRRAGGTVVSIVAAPDVGKTTLIASIYELIYRKRMSKFGFAGSETLRGYEERCFRSRLSSDAAVADTVRTPVSVGLQFTHLRIATSTGKREVLFADRSGEHFDRALGRPADIEDFIELHRAEAVLLLIDLVLLLKDPHITVSTVRRLFMAIDQRGLFDGKRVVLVGTKADLAIPTPRSRKALAAIGQIADEFRKRAGGRFDIDMHIVACRARRGSTAIGQGLEDLLSIMLTPQIPARLPADDSWPPSRTELDQLMRGYRAKQI